MPIALIIFYKDFMPDTESGYRNGMRTVKLFATLRDLAGAKTLDLPFERGSVRDLVRAIAEVCPPIAAKMLDEQGQLNGVVHILGQRAKLSNGFRGWTRPSKPTTN